MMKDALNPDHLSKFINWLIYFNHSSWTHKQAIYENCSEIWMSKQSVQIATKFK